MNSVSKNITFREIVNDVFNAMLQGKKFTKSELNSLIPEGMNKSAHDIIRQLQKPWVRIKISHQRKKKGQPAYWYINLIDIQAYQHSPDAYHASFEQQKEEASRKKALSNINAAKSRYGFTFIVNVLNAH